MKLEVEVNTVRDVLEVAGLTDRDLACPELLDLDRAYISLKVLGKRPIFQDELPRLLLAIRTRGTRRVGISMEQLAEVVGDNLKAKRYGKKGRR